MLHAVAYGAGTNSTAMLIGLQQKHIHIDFILMADTGAERPCTYGYTQKMNIWLIKHSMPPIITVRHIDCNGDVLTLEQESLKSNTLPSLAYGFKKCSLKHKIEPQNKFYNNLPKAREIWKRGEKVIKYIGYDADEERRVKITEDDKYIYKHPLIEWGWGRKECIKVIEASGLPLPGKSSCFFCPSMKKREIFDLKNKYPELLQRAIVIEQNAELTSIKGLGRSFSWKELTDNTKENMDIFFDVIEESCDCYDG